MRIIHIGDCQLGYRQYGLKQRETDFFAATTYVVDKAIELHKEGPEVGVFIWPGDMFEHAKPHGYVVQYLQRQVTRLRNAGIPSIGVSGNHGASASWLEVCGIHTFLSVHDVWEKDGISFFGINNCPAGQFMEKLEDDVLLLGAEVESIDVLIIHQSLAELCGFPGVQLSAEEMVPLLQTVNTRYVAMGDIHELKVADFGGVKFAYPGATEVNDTAEPKNKHFLEVNITKESGPAVVIHDIPVRKIISAVILAEKEMDKVINSLRGSNCLAIVYVHRDIVNGLQRVQQRLKEAEVMNRVTLLDKDEDGDAPSILSDAAKRKRWERKESLINIREVVTETYAEDSDEHHLILQALSRPGAIDDVVNDFLVTKGLGQNE